MTRGEIIIVVIQFILILAIIGILLWQILIKYIPSLSSSQSATLTLPTVTNATLPTVIDSFSEDIGGGKKKYTGIFSVNPTNLNQPVTIIAQFGASFSARQTRVLSTRVNGSYVSSGSTYSIMDIGASVLNGSSTALSTSINFTPSVSTENRIQIELIV